jgi:hypothetical protein
MTTQCRRFFLLKHKEEGDNTNYRCLLRCNKTKEEGDDSKLPLPSLLQQNHARKEPKEMKRREGAYLQALALAYHFWLSLQARCLGCYFYPFVCSF